MEYISFFDDKCQLAELRDANNALIASYVYRGDGKRAWKELASSGTRVYFYYSGEQLIASTNGNDASNLQLWGADGLVGSRNVNAGVTTKFYFLYDTQGNLALTLRAPQHAQSENHRAAAQRH